MKKLYHNQIIREKQHFDSFYRKNSHKFKNYFQKWLFSLEPAMPNTKECTDKILKNLGEIKGKRICDFGCGTGLLTYELAKRGAYVSAIDISKEAIKATKRKLLMFPKKQIIIKQMDACNLQFNNNSFDMIIGTFILHHIDIIKAAREINRVLKPGGHAFFTEPLAHNPISNIWRKLTPGVRSTDEWPLSYSEISRMSKYFTSTRYEEFDLLPLFSSLVYLVTFSTKAKKASAELLAKLDPIFLKLCKPLRRYSGEILIEFTK